MQTNIIFLKFFNKYFYNEIHFFSRNKCFTADQEQVGYNLNMQIIILLFSKIRRARTQDMTEFNFRKKISSEYLNIFNFKVRFLLSKFSQTPTTIKASILITFVQQLVLIQCWFNFLKQSLQKRKVLDVFKFLSHSYLYCKTTFFTQEKI